MTQPPRGRVVVIGSINRDLRISVSAFPRSGETVLANGMTTEHGGKGANQAVAAARAEAMVAFVGAVGDDDAGRAATKQLEAEGIEASGVTVIAGVATGTAVVLVADSGENQIVVVGGANAEVDPAAVARTLDSLRLTTTDVCLTGFEVGDEVLARTADIAAAAECRFVMNPAPARVLPQAVRAAHPVLLPNRVEALDLTGSEDPISAAQDLQRQTKAPVVITLGSEGALLLDGGELERVPAHPVKTVDTTGAGDTFAGVFCAYLASGSSLTEATHRGVLAASLSVTQRGARAGMPSREAIGSLATAS